MQYLSLLIFLLFITTKASASEAGVKIRVFNSLVTLPSSCVLSVRPSVLDKRVKYICESKADDFSQMNLIFREFNPKELGELESSPEISDFKITSLGALNYYTAELAQPAGSYASSITMRLLCNVEYCAHIMGANSEQLKKLAKQFGVKYL